MSSEHARVPGTLAVRKTERGPVRVMHSAAAPDCPKCGTNEHVLRLWHGNRKMWACSVHFKVGSTKTEPQTLKDRVLHRAPKQEEFALTDILPNRAARRRRK